MKLELVVPTQLSEIPLKHYQKFLGIAENTNDEIFLAEKMIQCFCGIELKEIVKIPFKEVEALSIHFATMLTMDYRLVDVLNADQLEVGDLIGLNEEVVRLIEIAPAKFGFVITYENEFGEKEISDITDDEQFELFILE